MTYIEHITLTTGHKRRSFRAEIDGAALSAVSVCLALALSRTHTRAALMADPPPALQPYTLSATAAGACMVATVWHEDAPICTIGVADDSRCAVRLWRMLHQTANLDVITSPDQRPQAPWCAARLDVGISAHMDAATWLGDFERHLAWAWIETRP